MSPAAAMMIPSTRPEDPITILFLSDSGIEGSVGNGKYAHLHV